MKEICLGSADFLAVPGVPLTKDDMKLCEKPPELPTAFRDLAARLDYLYLDRRALQFAATQVSKKMARPREVDWGKLKRLARG